MINSKYRKLVLFLIAALSTSGCNSETIQQQEVNYTHTVTSQKLDNNTTNQLISQNTNNGQNVDQSDNISTSTNTNSDSFLPLWVWCGPCRWCGGAQRCLYAI